MAASKPVRSLPAVQWKTAGWASWPASAVSAPADLRGGLLEHLVVLRAEEAGRLFEVVGVGISDRMKGKWWKSTGCASTSNRLCSTS